MRAKTKCLARVGVNNVIPVVYLCQAQYAPTAQRIFLCLLVCFLINNFVEKATVRFPVTERIIRKYALCCANKCRIVYRKDASILSSSIRCLLILHIQNIPPVCFKKYIFLEKADILCILCTRMHTYVIQYVYVHRLKDALYMKK